MTNGSTRKVRVSIGIPVFNGGRFLEQTLISLLSQTFTDFEIVISNNASTDNTEDICRAYMARDPRVRYYRADSNGGAAWNHNRVFHLSTGEYFKWNSADDLCGPEFISRCVEALDRDQSAVMAHVQPIEINELGECLESISVANHTLVPLVPEKAPVHIRFRENIRLDHLCLSIYSLIRSDVLRQTDLIGHYADSDRVLLAQLALFGSCIGLSYPGLFNRDHPGRFTRYYNGQRLHERAAWSDPSNGSRRIYPKWKELSEFVRIIRKAALGPSDKLRCYSEIVRWLSNWEHSHLLYIDATYYPRRWVVQRYPGAKTAWQQVRKVSKTSEVN